MKKLNKKGFTLIELLAVVVILAILVTVSVPAVVKYLGTARRETYATNALRAIDAAKGDYITNGYTGQRLYTLNTSATGKEINLNNLLDKKLNNSPYGSKLSQDSYILADSEYKQDTKQTITTFKICLIDEAGNAIGVKNNDGKTMDAVEEDKLAGDSTYFTYVHVPATGFSCVKPVIK